MLDSSTRLCTDLRYMKGLAFPADVKFGHVLVTGPPGAGKSTLIRRLGGWSEEGYLDISQPRWWTDQALALRPREIHLGFPFAGFRRGLAVFDPEWLDAYPHPRLVLARVQIPPPKRHFLSVNWRGRYVFEFLLPPARELYEQRRERAQRGTHPVDRNVSLDLITAQLQVFRQTAAHLARSGVRAYLREGVSKPPLCFVEAGHADE